VCEVIQARFRYKFSATKDIPKPAGHEIGHLSRSQMAEIKENRNGG
jgi:hypothetical protein